MDTLDGILQAAGIASAHAMRLLPSGEFEFEAAVGCPGEAVWALWLPTEGTRWDHMPTSDWD
ncbi:hypothetical protein Ssi02_63130 [Sinosporangium siamense]|uniref:Uncharacterized protein n=1 Tax=Sinosporangium siamense TaxID=1367973 RepID=A0A919RLN1_9ACTN|nr:hypothetical protein Ssi02_63130 [Sinosporangium siamense]